MDEALKRDENYVPVGGAVTDDSDQDVRQIRVDPITGRLLSETQEADVDTPTIYNVSLSTANTEVGQGLPDGTKKLDVKVRSMNTQLKVSFVSGESGTKYITIPYNGAYHLEGVNLSNTIYMQTSRANQVAEIVCWT